MAEDFISGMLAGQQFQQNNFLLQEAPIKLEQEKMALTIQKADFDRRQKMADLLAAKPPKPDENPLTNATNALFAMGSAAVQSGLVEEAQKHFQTAATLTIQQEDAAYKQYQEAALRAKTAAEYLSTTHDEASWKAMNQYIELTTGKPSAMKDKPYSPELVQALREASVKHLDDATEAYRRAQAHKAQAEEALIPERIKLMKTQEEANERRVRDAKKVGGDGLLAKARTVRATTDYIVQQSNDMISTVDARVIAEKIGPDVEARMISKNQTLSEAVHDAYVHYEKTGGLAGVSPPRSRIGTSWKMPAPPPKDLSQLKDRTIYQTPNGPMWYDAKTKKMYPQNTGAEGPLIEDEEEDDE